MQTHTFYKLLTFQAFNHMTFEKWFYPGRISAVLQSMENVPFRRGEGEDTQNPPPAPSSGGNSPLTACSLTAWWPSYPAPS
jgi:hypothetical protein